MPVPGQAMSFNPLTSNKLNLILAGRTHGWICAGVCGNQGVFKGKILSPGEDTCEGGQQSNMAMCAESRNAQAVGSQRFIDDI